MEPSLVPNDECDLVGFSLVSALGNRILMNRSVSSTGKLGNPVALFNKKERKRS